MLGGLLLATFTSLTYAINPLQVNGTKFFDSVTGDQFFIKGVAYQPSDANQTTANAASGSQINDPLADPTGCTQAVSLLQELGANVIRTYEVNSTLNHDECMQTFADAGIYLFLDLETPYTTVVSDDPTWTVEQYEEFTANVDAFAQYPNTAGFFIGNEVVNAYNVSSAATFVKAAARDMRAYIAAKGYRAIPVGYAGADVANLQIQLAEYLSCGDATDGIDFYGINIYRWCGNSTYTESGYDILEAQYTNLTRPVFFSEFGCNIPLGQTRTFGDIPSLYGIMSNVFSGGIAYEWVEEANSYGLVTSASAGASPTPLPDFSVLSSRWAAVSPSSTALSDYDGTTASVSCPPLTSGFVAATSLPPSPDAGYCSCEVAAVKCSATAASAAGTAIASAFAIVCGLNDGAACTGVVANGTSPGTYGQYGFCSGAQQLALVYQAYYSQQSSTASACGFSLATLVASPAAASTCSHDAIAAIVTDSAATATSGTKKTTSSTTGTSTSSSSSTTSYAMRSTDINSLMIFVGTALAGGLAFIVL